MTKGSVHFRIFNTGFECGLRSLYLLYAMRPKKAEIERLVFYDYLLVHSNDIEGGPVSIHPDNPNRSGEWITKRDILQEGLNLMVARELIQVHYDTTGVAYSATELTGPFISLLASAYSSQLRSTATWCHSEFGGYTQEQLKSFMFSNVNRWGNEALEDSNDPLNRKI